MTMFGITNYDRCGGLEKLVFDIKKAIDEAKKAWRTLSMDKIKQLTQLCIVRELT